jgi:hypothetical protein
MTRGPGISGSATESHARTAVPNATCEPQHARLERSSFTVVALMPVTLTAGKPPCFFMINFEVTGNPSPSKPTRFRLPLRFFWWVPKLTGTSAPIYLPQKKAKMILDVSHAIAFLGGGRRADLPLSRIHSQHFSNR